MHERLVAFSLRALLLGVAYISMLLAAFCYPGNVVSILWRCTLFGTLILAVLPRFIDPGSAARFGSAWRLLAGSFL